MADDAVCCELFSASKFPANRENAGNFWGFGLLHREKVLVL
jgi:hypothetical protein